MGTDVGTVTTALRSTSEVEPLALVALARDVDTARATYRSVNALLLDEWSPIERVALERQLVSVGREVAKRCRRLRNALDMVATSVGGYE